MISPVQRQFLVLTTYENSESDLLGLTTLAKRLGWKCGHFGIRLLQNMLEPSLSMFYGSDKTCCYFGVGGEVPAGAQSVRPSLSVHVVCQTWAFTGFGRKHNIWVFQLSPPSAGRATNFAVLTRGTDVTWSHS